MKKHNILVALLLSVSMMTSMVKANDASIRYEGDADTFIKTTDTSSAFVDMMPGEERTQTIELTNENFDTMKFFVKVDEANLLNETSNGTIVYDIAFKKDGEVFYTGKIGGANRASKGNLTQSYLLKDLKKGESTSIEMSIKLDATSMTNDYQGSAGNLGIVFSVEHSDNNKVVEIVKKIPIINKIPGISTGDSTSVYGVLIAMMACVFVIVVIVMKRRKEDKHEKA